MEFTSELCLVVIKANGAYTNHDVTFTAENQRTLLTVAAYCSSAACSVLKSLLTSELQDES